MPTLELMVARKTDGRTFCEAKTNLDVDGYDADFLREVYGDNWEYLTVTAKSPSNGDELQINQDCIVYQSGREPRYDAALEPLKRFVRLVQSLSHLKPPSTEPYLTEGPTEEMFKRFEPPLIGRLIDAWLQGLCYPNILQDPDFFAALKRKRDALEAATPSPSATSTPES